MKQQYDLVVAYRICPRISKLMAVYPEDKLKLSEFCLRSFKKSLGSLKVKMFVLLDNCPAEYEALFLEYFDERDLRLIRLNGIGNRATFCLQVETLVNQDDAEFVYFAEDDYFFLPNQFAQMIEFLKHSSDVHFVSPYDHPDYYTRDIHKHKYEIRAYATHHWRTAVSATLSFLTTKQILTETKNVFNKYYNSNAPDYSIWMSITKSNVLNPFRIMKYLFCNRVYSRMIARAWIYCWRQILFGRRWKLWIPMPSIATHMEKRLLPFCVDWKEKFELELLQK
jgi:hypothetical protein